MEKEQHIHPNLVAPANNKLDPAKFGKAWVRILSEHYGVAGKATITVKDTGEVLEFEYNGSN